MLGVLQSIGCPHWVEGGWGVDALAGRQTRQHRDADIDIDATREADAIAALAAAGYVESLDGRPTRIELIAADGSCVDLHPLHFDATGDARQFAPDGSGWTFRRGWFTVGTLAGRRVPCFTADAQRYFRTGYELREVDRADLAILDRLTGPDGGDVRHDGHMGLNLTGDAQADDLLSRDPFALLVGMLLDQQFPMERAFAGPRLLADRLGVDRLDPRAIAEHDPEAFAALAVGPPAVHRYPGSMAARIQALARIVVDEYDGDAAAIWTTATSGTQLLGRLRGLPGFGEQKARIFVALLGKQCDVQPEGWREAAGAYGQEGSRRSIADVVDATTLAEVRAFKQQQKAAAKAT